MEPTKRPSDTQPDTQSDPHAFNPLDPIPDQIKHIEACLRDHDIRIDDFCTQIDINRSTWTRWKAGTHDPSISAWRHVLASLRRAYIEV